MISDALLRAVLTIEAALVAACLGAVATHGIWLWRRTRADAPRLALGHRALAAIAGAGEGEGDAAADASAERLAELRRLPRRVQRRVVEELAVSVAGEEGRRVAGVAASLGLVAAAARRCRSRWWWRRLLGAHQLNVYGRGDDALPPLFDDPHPAVRAQVVEWAGDARRVDLAGRLVAALDDPSALCRHTAADSILRAGAPLVDALAGELDARQGQQRAALLAVLARRPDPRYRQAALDSVDDQSPDVRAAAAALLGGVGGADAGTALQRLLGDAEAAVRAAAADGLRRLGHQRAAPALALLLADPSYTVRRAAGGALAALGPGGILLLRHHVGDDDPLAAEMARHALDVAAVRAPG